MIQYYKGFLGDFEYDDELWDLSQGRLHYIGNEAFGINIHIPRGIIDCTDMFAGNTFLQTPPKIPDGVKYCSRMFLGCQNLKYTPELPASVEYCDYMFQDCTALQINVCTIFENIEAAFGMFKGCMALKYEPLLSGNIRYCDEMFCGCTSLQNYSLPADWSQCTEINSGCRPMLQEMDKFVKQFTNYIDANDLPF